MDRSLTVVEAGPLTTVQDRGRAGWAHLGVPRAGALDRPAADLANRLVGNRAAAALLETTFGGLTVTVASATTVAATGAPAELSVDGRAIAWAEPTPVRAGQTLRMGAPRQGVRGYLAVAGGIAVAPVLGSRATDTLAWVGPPPLEPGAVLPVGPPQGPPRPVDVAQVRRAGRPVVLRVTPGPRVDWFTDTALGTLTGSTYTVGADSSRVALRLHGAALTRRHGDELLSEGLLLGAVQVPPSGEPLVFLNDHPTTGGYPVLAVVAADDLAACAQLRPGEPVRFRPR
jgi:biotin-dependent carboxylase-like uncharacterized protein